MSLVMKSENSLGYCIGPTKTYYAEMYFVCNVIHLCVKNSKLNIIAGNLLIKPIQTEDGIKTLVLFPFYNYGITTSINTNYKSKLCY